MLSILIPIYNYEVRDLVMELKRQAVGSGRPVEILLMDDGSPRPDHNAELADGKTIFYQKLAKNIGRAAIRNRLADRANFPNLLFIDADATVVSSSFLEDYFRNIDPKTVLCGGTCYAAEPPSDPAQFLRWHYGAYREQRPAAQRDRTGFTTFNFLIPKNIFQKIRFEELRSYGHEDTLFGYELARRGIPIRHLDNPLRHDGLEPARVFLEKSIVAIENLQRINQPEVRAPTTLWRAYEQLHRVNLTGFYRKIFEKMHSRMERNLLGPTPSLRLFDLWKLGVLIHEISKEKTL